MLLFRVSSSSRLNVSLRDSSINEAAPEYDVVSDVVYGWDTKERDVLDVGIEDESGEGDWDEGAVCGG
jgi:hypothetical protein